MFVKKVIITITFALISVLSIFSGAIIQKYHSEKYVQTSASLLYEKSRTKMPSILTYVYRVDDKSYTINKTSHFAFSKRNISYDKITPNFAHFGHTAPAAKVLLFIGTLFAMITLFVLFGLILNLSFAYKMQPCIFLYFTAGIAVLTESVLAALLIAFFTLMIIAVCISVNKNIDEEYY